MWPMPTLLPRPHRLAPERHDISSGWCRRRWIWRCWTRCRRLLAASPHGGAVMITIRP